MKILVDADACPRAVKEILFRAVQRRKIPTTLIANQYIRVPPSEHIDSIAVTAGPDEADDRIVELVEPEDLVITADIPLADRVVAKGATALDPRGKLLTALRNSPSPTAASTPHERGFDDRHYLPGHPLPVPHQFRR